MVCPDLNTAIPNDDYVCMKCYRVVINAFYNTLGLVCGCGATPSDLWYNAGSLEAINTAVATLRLEWRHTTPIPT